MSNRSSLAQQVHLHWVRETPSRALELPVSRTLHSLDSLPECVQNAVRATGLPELELHLPPFVAATVSYEDWCDGLRFRQDAAGRLIASSANDSDPLATMALHQAMTLIFRAIANEETPLTIVAEPGPSAILRQPLAARHVCLPGGGLAAAPAERSRHYDRTYKAISLALQAAIRDSLPPAHVESIAQFEDRQHVHSLLAWSAAAPVVGRTVDQLGLDIFNARMLKRAFDGVPGRLAPRLAEVREILVRHGAPKLIRNSYSPSKAGHISRHCRERSRFLNLLFMNEFRLISAFVHFCTRIGSWRERGGQKPKRVYREAREAWAEVEVHIRGFYQRHRHSAIGSVLLLEAVRVLEAVDWNNAE